MAQLTQRTSLFVIAHHPARIALLVQCRKSFLDQFEGSRHRVFLGEDRLRFEQQRTRKLPIVVNLPELRDRIIEMYEDAVRGGL